MFGPRRSLVRQLSRLLSTRPKVQIGLQAPLNDAVLLTALRGGVSLDCPATVPERTMTDALDRAAARLKEEDDEEARRAHVQLTYRLGYRAAESESLEADARVEELVHNLSEEFVRRSMQSSALVERYQQGRMGLVVLAHNPETQLVAFLQRWPNATRTDAKLYMKQCLTSAFVGLERATLEGCMDAYGVDSNGLSLPRDHVLHVDWRDVLECAVDAYTQVHATGKTISSLRVIRLPGNMVETRGVLEVASEIQEFLEQTYSPSQATDQERKLHEFKHILPQTIQVHVTRPLTAYPHGGTSVPHSDSSDNRTTHRIHPLRIRDYRIEVSENDFEHEDPHLEWTNCYWNRHGPRPALYHPVLNNTLSHFDAESILEASRERALTVEERETLDGCRLLRDMIHDLDNSLEEIKSFAAYEDYLMNVAIPLIHGSFEGLDEESAEILQKFFRVHGMAVKMVVARWTRNLLLGGWRSQEKVLSEAGQDDVSLVWDEEKAVAMAKIWQSLGFQEFPQGYNIPEDVPLQEFALRYVLSKDSVHGVVVGCSSPEHVLEALRIADTVKKDV